MTVGIESSLASAKVSNGSGTSLSENKVNALRLGAFLRYSMPIAGMFSFYTDLGVGMQNAKVTNTSGSISTDSKAKGIYVGITPAIGVNMNKGFCLNFSIGGLGYDTWKADVTGAQQGSNFGLTFGKQASVGISKNF